MNGNTKIKEILMRSFHELEGNNFAILGEPDILMWQEPLIGVAAGNDPYFSFLKEHIGKFYFEPAEVFKLKYQEANPENLRVISLVFPQSEIAKEEQARGRTFPGDHWLIARGEWEQLMEEYAASVMSFLEKDGIKAVFVDERPEITLVEAENLGITARWSHRHTAYAAGLGTFGLSDAFISEKGKANRITSIIVEAELDIDSRGDRGPYDWCLYFAKGICGACIRRCPVRAISEKGHDKKKCMDYEDEIEKNLWPEHIERKNYNFGCGLCQVKIPCQNKKPL